MKSRLRSLLIGGCVGGGVYAAMMAAFDYVDNQEFSLWKFPTSDAQNDAILLQFAERAGPI